MFSSNTVYVRVPSEVPREFDSQAPFAVQVPIHKSWPSSKRRILIVLEHVDSEDLYSGKLMSAIAGSWVRNAFNLGSRYAKFKGQASFAAVNFNYFKTYDLSPSEVIAANSYAADRVRAFIAKYRPTDVIIFGDQAAYAILKDYTDAHTLLKRRGRPLKFGKIWYTTTVSLSGAYQRKAGGEDEEDETAIDIANLLGYVSKCVGHALIRKPAYEINVTPKVVLIDTLPKFIKLYRKLMQAKVVAVDSETSSLGRIVNKLLTVQFSFNPTTSYLIPIDHRDAKWTAKENRQIKKGLKAFFARDFDHLSKDYGTYLIGQNLKFDLTVLRQALGIFMIKWPVWDLMAGEYLLDENLKTLSKFRLAGGGKVSPYQLDTISCWYGCDFYLENEFSKDNRHTIETRDLTDQALQRYCGMDTQTAFAIHTVQQARAQDTIIEGASYGDRYQKFMVRQMSNIVHIGSCMEHKGARLDIPYLIQLRSKEGPLQELVRKVLAEFKQLPTVKKANARLVKEANLPSTGLWGSDTWVFSVTKPTHKQTLFFDIMKLEPVSFGKTGPSVDKEFQATYKDKKEVELFTKLSQIEKIRSTYVDGYYARMSSDPDMASDYCLRASYGFTATVTGRNNSFDPNLQNIPEHGEFAAVIKRAFIAPEGHLGWKMDFSSHEVRVWGLIAQDTILCYLFVTGRWLRQQYRKTGNKVYRLLMNTIGDIHKLNAAFFFAGVAPDTVTPEQRNSVKSIVFGAIYGRSAAAIATQAKASVDSIKSLLLKFFGRFKKAGGWLDKAKDHSVKHNYMYSLTWRIRNQFAHLFDIESLTAGVRRRGCNAPVQGLAADFGQTAATLFMLHIERFLKEFPEFHSKGVPTAGVSTFVHDAIKGPAPYAYYLAAIQIMQWCATTGVHEYYKHHWGIKFLVELEVDFELFAHDASHYKWDWHDGADGEGSSGGLEYCVRKAVADQKQVFPDIDIDAVTEEILAIRSNKRVTSWLNSNYPVMQDWADAQHIDTKAESFKTGLLRTIKKKLKELA